MDLSQFNTSVAPVKMEVTAPVPPFQKLEGVVLELVSQDSPVVKSIERRIIDARLKMSRRQKRIEISSEDLENENLEKMAGSIVGWSGISLGEPLAYSHGNAVRLLKELPWLLEQVEEFVTDRANFTKSSESQFLTSPPFSSSSPRQTIEESRFENTSKPSSGAPDELLSALPTAQ